MSIQSDIKDRQDEIDAKIRESKDELSYLQGVNNGEVHSVATYLHEKNCHSNHTDQCGWFYEEWDGATHQPYLKLAQDMIDYAKQHNAPLGELIDFVVRAGKL